MEEDNTINIAFSKESIERIIKDTREPSPKATIDDLVNHPDHYSKHCSIECIDIMKMYYGKFNTSIFCVMNAFKYLWRWESKNGTQDLEKARWYITTAKSINSEFGETSPYSSSIVDDYIHDLELLLTKAEKKAQIITF